MADEFYLPEDTVEWIGQKKSELLAWVIQHRRDDDVPFEDFGLYADNVEDVLKAADESWAQRWDGHAVHIMIKHFEEESLWLFVVCYSAPVEGREGDHVMVPILVLPTRHTAWLRSWLRGEAITKRALH